MLPLVGWVVMGVPQKPMRSHGGIRCRHTVFEAGEAHVRVWNLQMCMDVQSDRSRCCTAGLRFENFEHADFDVAAIR